MNKGNYKKWLEELLIPNLPANSVVVVDNAPYHNTVIEKVPNSGSTKQEMRNWLDKMNIAYTNDMLKPTLYALICRNKPAYKKYEIDEILSKHNHTCLRLPPYHPDLNPIENIWAIVKGWVASRNTTYKIADVKKLCEDKFGSMTENDWLPLCRHVLKTEADYWESDHIMDERIDPIIIALGGPDSEDDEDAYNSDNPDEPDSDLSGIEGMECDSD
ncbi:uncharacterized protein LOC128984429 [Macrosteles quadrilineatus]|uniref:uncharacterized protein LOC128984429 n=1 Tax=Macrosteles quadrilineatus TaxID=74068 RepID=UPI0023E25A3E|nr:uncharacterized protein LOC128984429 [Macrosteles quadrilineatus]